MRLVAFLFAIAPIIPVSAQEEAPKARIGITAGVSALATAHYHAPIPILLCFEGCTPQRQTAGFGSGFDVGVNIAFSKRLELVSTLGYSSVRFHEEGLSNDGGGGSVSPYVTDVGLSFLNNRTGLKWNFFKGNYIGLFWTNALMTEVDLTGDIYLSAAGVSYITNLGIEIPLGDVLAISGSGVFRTAISRYDATPPGTVIAIYRPPYRPWGVGAEIGVTARFGTKAG